MWMPIPSPSPMDGFHFSNTYLESHNRVLPDGKEIPLSTVKGQPDTIDIKTLRQHIQNSSPARKACPGRAIRATATM